MEGEFTITAGAWGAAEAAATGPPGSVEEPSGSGSQKATSMPPATHEEGRVAAKVAQWAHSLRQAGVISSPDEVEQEAMCTLAGVRVQPGYAR